MSARTQILLLLSGLLITAFACLALNEVLLPSRTPSRVEPLTPTPGAACPDVLAQIMDSATSGVRDRNLNEFGAGQETVILTYQVLGDQLSDPHYEAVSPELNDEQNATATHEQIWSLFSSLIPPEQREIVAEFSIITDGNHGTLASVAQTSTNPERWALEVDIVDAANKVDLTYTLVHEFGHLLTLGPQQVQPSLAVFDTPHNREVYEKEMAACPSYFPGEGCSRTDSYISIFYTYFWQGIYGEWRDINLLEGEAAHNQALDRFYLEFKDQFVTDYAVISPEEDIAESWSFFVLGPKPNGATTAEQKILFFYDFPELVQLREVILNNLCAAYP